MAKSHLEDAGRGAAAERHLAGAGQGAAAERHLEDDGRGAVAKRLAGAPRRSAIWKMMAGAPWRRAIGKQLRAEVPMRQHREETAGQAAVEEQGRHCRRAKAASATSGRQVFPRRLPASGRQVSCAQIAGERTASVLCSDCRRRGLEFEGDFCQEVDLCLRIYALPAEVFRTIYKVVLAIPSVRVVLFVEEVVYNSGEGNAGAAL